MAAQYRPHVLGIDDGPFDKGADREATLVGVMTEGPDLIEAVAVTRFAVDGDGIAEFLTDWISGLRCSSALHGIVLGGLTIAGLAVVDIELLARRCGLPVMVVNRQEPGDAGLTRALRSAGLESRVAILDRSPPAWKVSEGLFVAHAGIRRQQAARLLHAIRGKSHLPEPLRLAHLIGAAIVNGQSRGRP